MIHRGYPGSEGRQEYGQGEVLDIGNLVDHLSNDPRIDPRRMGIMGYSRGAHNALLATQRYDNFRAAVLWSAPVDMVDHVRVNPWIAETIGGTARDNPRIYRELSAIHHVDSINCPLLLIYGEPDTLRLVEALKSQGKAVELKCWPLEGHIWSPLGLFQKLAPDHSISSDACSIECQGRQGRHSQERQSSGTDGRTAV